MRRRLLSVMLALVVLPLSSSPVWALGTLDQQAAESNSGNGVAVPSAQTFTAGLTGNLDTVALYEPFGITTWNVAIKAVDLGGLPTGPDLATGTGTPTAGWTLVTLSPAIPVSAGTSYAIVLTPPVSAWDFSSISYPGGTFFLDGVDQGFDRAFRTYVTLPAPEPIHHPILFVTNTVSTTEAGVGSSTVTAPTGSMVWRTVGMINGGDTILTGVTLADSAGSLPASCPAVPSTLAPGATYRCAFSVPVGTGTTTYTTTATSGALKTIGTAQVVASLGATAIGSRLGLPDTAGGFSATTKVAALGGYVSWHADMGPGAAGSTVGVYVASKLGDGTWGPWSRLTSRMADAAGVVQFSRRESAPVWLSVRFSLDGTHYSRSSQARWR